MLKSFAGLWLLVFGPLFFLLYPSSFNPVVRFNEYIEGQRFTKIYQGTFFLIESQLNILPVSKWENKTAQLNTKFGFEIKLRPLMSLNLSNQQQNHLHQGNIVFINAEPEYLLKKMGNSEIVLQLFTDFSAAEKIYRGAQGTVYLLQKTFNQAAQSDWPSIIHLISGNSPFSLKLQERARLQISAQENRKLATQSCFWREGNSNELSFYIPLKDGTIFLVADLIPMSSINPSVIFLLILIFVLFISICMFLWVYPLWRDLNSLVHATSRFGKENLNSRAVVSRISIVATLGSTFNRMAERIEQLLEGQKRLTNSIAHDLRTPLYRLRFACEMLSKSSPKEEDLQYWTSISKSIEDLDYLINQTLQLSRYSSDNQLVTFAKHSLPQLINEECMNVFQLYPNIKYKLKLQLEAEQTWAFIDHIAIKRAISNLLVNACKHAHSYVTFSLSYCIESSEYIIEINDDGLGIKEHDLERIFLPFEQLNNEQRDAHSGHGLGLTIVRHIAHWHSGTVEAGHSKLGGAKFVFRWPCTN